MSSTEFREDIKNIIGSITGEKGKVLILDKKENLNRWEGFKCVSYDELLSIKDKFDVVIVNDLEGINSEELMRVGNKFIILNFSLNERLIEKSDEVLDRITSEKLDDEMKFLDKISGDKKEKLLEKKKLSYVILEKEDLISKPSFFFNLAMIQNLKKQIAEREKIIASQIKDIEILKSRVKYLEHDFNNSERLKNESEVRLKNLEILGEKKEKEIIKEKKEIIKRYAKEVSDLSKQVIDLSNQLNNLQLFREQEKKELIEEIKTYTKKINDLNKQINDLQLLGENEKKELTFNFSEKIEEKEKEILRLKNDFEAQLKNLERERDRLAKNRDEEIKRLKEQLQEIRDSTTFKIVSAVTKRISKAKK